MTDSAGTNQELLDENTVLKQRILRLEQSEQKRKKFHEWTPEITAFILFLTLYVLWLNLDKLDKQITSAKTQADASQKQLELTQALNQPLCAVKDLKVDKVRNNVVQITPIIKNFGKIAEKNASFKWKIDIVMNLNNPQKREIIENRPWMIKEHIKILPEQEFIGGFIQYQIKDFNDMVKGYDSAVLVSMVTGYHDSNKESQQYLCTYLITRLADVKEDLYEVTLNEAK